MNIIAARNVERAKHLGGLYKKVAIERATSANTMTVTPAMVAF